MKYINTLLNKWMNLNPWTNVYGFSRSILALSALLTLCFNKVEYLFREGSNMDNFPISGAPFTLFMYGQNNYTILAFLKLFAIIILILVLIGWRPRITAILHWYIAYSMQNNLTIADGGEQVAAVITFLIIPIALTDNRKWHWKKQATKGSYSKIIAFTTYYIIRLQISIIYFHSIIAKLKDSEWIDGTAVYYFTKDTNLGFNHLFQFLTDWIFDSKLVVFTSWLPLIVQFILCAALLVSKKYWKYILIFGVLMHEIFALCLGLMSFSLTMFGVLILYLTPIESEMKNLKLKWRKRYET